MNNPALRKNHTVEKSFIKYVSQNILGMIGMSAYVLVDTFFISVAEGANGITALNLVLPLYSFIFAIGSMIGTGSAIRFKILRARNDNLGELYFSNSIFFALIFGAVFMAIGAFAPDKIIALLGGTPEIVSVGTSYTRMFLLFAPFFMINYICNAFVRNDDAPSLAMFATLSSSIFNIIMDYIFMFIFNMGMTGAALATSFSPIVGSLICCTHLFSKKSTVKFKLALPNFRRLFKACQLGISAFVGEISSGVTTMVFNILILGIAGNIGIAAYGVVANIAIVATSIFNGISQGSQPLLSNFYGKCENTSLKKGLRLSLFTAFIFSILIIICINLIPDIIIAVFNRENNAGMASYALTGLRLYFIGYIFAGLNIVGTGYLSATEKAGWSFTASVLRGVVAIILCAVVLSHLFGMTGVWLAFPAAELLTLIVVIIAIITTIKNTKTQGTKS